MSGDLPIDSMTTSEKLAAMEALWASLCKKPSEVDSPGWHATVLAERKRRLESGDAALSDWDAAKKRLREAGQ